MENEQYISPFNIKKRFDVSSNTLRTWAEKGDIRFIRIREGLGKRLYHIKDVEKIFGTTSSENVIKRETICYARVSSNHQKEDLSRQIELLEKTYPGTKILSDIGSGLNFKRKNFETLLELVYEGKVDSVVVTYKDRLCRFGSELIEWLFKKSGTKLVVLDTLSSSGTSEESGVSELAEDLLAITTVFVARNNGNRSAKYRKARKLERLSEQIEKDD
jgi:putative resolvase